MDRTDRLYALVEDLRAVAPRRRSARQLALRYEVSARTIERDIAALQQSGVPIYADVGRTGGYALDKRMSLPPLNFTPAEVVAIGVALRRLRGTPFDPAGTGALAKIMAVLSDESAGAARDLAERVRLVEELEQPATPAAAAVVQEAIARRRVVEMGYADRFGAVTRRQVEPMTLLCGHNGWYLVGWCRLRAEARVFRLDRISNAELGEPAPAPRPLHAIDDLPPEWIVRPVAL